MAITEDQVIGFIESALDVAAIALPAPMSTWASVISKVSRPVFEAITAGGSAEKLTQAIRMALISEADDEARSTLGP